MDDRIEQLVARNRTRELVFRNRLREGRYGQPSAVTARTRSPQGTLEQRRASRSVLRGVRTVRQITPEWEYRSVANGTGGESFRFQGFAAIFDSPYEIWDAAGSFIESCDPGCFTKTLSEIGTGRTGKDVVFTVGHRFDSIPLARVANGSLRLSQRMPPASPAGLHVEATLDGSRSDIRDVVRAVDAGTLQGMSMSFVTVRDRWNQPEFTRRHLVELSLANADVALVSVPASGATNGHVSVMEGVSSSLPVATRRGANSVAQLVARNRAREAEFRRSVS